MFGYLRPRLKKQPRVYKREFQTVYRGLCRSLRENYELLGAVSLNYELTAFLLLALSLNDVKYECHRRICSISPFRIVRCVKLPDSGAEVADASVYTVGHKIDDNCRDNGGVQWSLIRLLYSKPFNKAGKRLGMRRTYIDQSVYIYYQAEDSGQSALHEFARANGEIISAIAMCVGENVPPEAKDDFRKLAFLTGEWLYIADAFDDYSADQKKNRFNPLNVVENKGSAASFLRELTEQIERRINSMRFFNYEYIVRQIFVYNLRSECERVLKLNSLNE